MENKNNYVVYIHINKINGKSYVGQSSNLQKRWRNNGEDYQKSPYFWNAIQKYGWDNFEHIVLLDNLTKEEADLYEDYYINEYKSRYNENGYNIREGGSRGALAEETKKKISKIMKDKGLWKGDLNPRHLDPLYGERNGMYGKHHTEETKEKISEALTGRKLSEEHKQAIREFMNTKHPRAKKVRCIETGEIFLSARKAAEAYNTSHSCIARVCNGERKTTSGKHWEWVEDDIN
jgi:group I intron endonuclease